MKLLMFLLLIAAGQVQAEQIRIAAASDMKYAMDELIATFSRSHPQDQIDASYGSSGKFAAQIREGAPFDLFFSADIRYPLELSRAGLAKGEVRPYARGSIVLWSQNGKIKQLSELTLPEVKKIALANPKHAPYGLRAKQALIASGLWDKLENKIVYGENVAQAAQFVQTGNADAGIIALSLAIHLATPYTLIPQQLHDPLNQGYMLTLHAGKLAQQFAQFASSRAAAAILNRHGFIPP